MAEVNFKLPLSLLEYEIDEVLYRRKFLRYWLLSCNENNNESLGNEPTRQHVMAREQLDL